MTDTPAPPPANATAARATLDAHMTDQAWVDRVFSGDPAAKKELNDLTTMVATGAKGADVVAAIMNGDLPQAGATSDERVMAATAGMLRDIGFPAKAIEETILGKEPTPVDIDRARAWKIQAFQNADWVKRYLAGDGDARREMMAADIVLSSAPEAVS